MRIFVFNKNHGRAEKKSEVLFFSWNPCKIHNLKHGMRGIFWIWGGVHPCSPPHRPSMLRCFLKYKIPSHLHRDWSKLWLWIYFSYLLRLTVRRQTKIARIGRVDGISLAWAKCQLIMMTGQQLQWQQLGWRSSSCYRCAFCQLLAAPAPCFGQDWIFFD